MVMNDIAATLRFRGNDALIPDSCLTTVTSSGEELVGRAAFILFDTACVCVYIYIYIYIYIERWIYRDIRSIIKSIFDTHIHLLYIYIYIYIYICVCVCVCVCMFVRVNAASSVPEWGDSFERQSNYQMPI